MDEFRHPRAAQKARDAARDVELAELHKTMAIKATQIDALKAAKQAAEDEEKRILVARTPAILAHQRCMRRQGTTFPEVDRMKRWDTDLIKFKLRALVEDGVDEAMDVREEEPNGVGSVRWWMEMAREENIRDGGSGSLFGGSIKTRKLLGTGQFVEWDDKELEAEMSKI